jgi:hypothetical protein
MGGGVTGAGCLGTREVALAAEQGADGADPGGHIKAAYSAGLQRLSGDGAGRARSGLARASLGVIRECSHRCRAGAGGRFCRFCAKKGASSSCIRYPKGGAAEKRFLDGFSIRGACGPPDPLQLANIVAVGVTTFGTNSTTKTSKKVGAPVPRRRGVGVQRSHAATRLCCANCTPTKQSIFQDPSGGREESCCPPSACTRAGQQTTG